MSITTDLPTTEDLACLVRCGQICNTLGDLLEEIAARVFEPVTGADPDDEIILEQDFGGPNDSFQIWISAPPTPLTWLDSRDEASMFALVGLPAGIDHPKLRLQAGVAWLPTPTERRRLERPIWVATLQRAGFAFTFQDDELCVITKDRDLFDPEVGGSFTNEFLAELSSWVLREVALILRACDPSLMHNATQSSTPIVRNHD